MTGGEAAGAKKKARPSGRACYGVATAYFPTGLPQYHRRGGA